MNAALPSHGASRCPARIFGPAYNRLQGWTFQITAPKAQSVKLTFSNDGKNWFDSEMIRAPGGQFVCTEPRIHPGARYWFVIDGQHGYPDPWSRCQPDGPHGASMLVNEENYQWRDHNWQGLTWSASIVYELHIGTFTPEGTFLAALDRLEMLQALGVTALQIMPVWTSPQGVGWGYDCNYLFSVNPAYGTLDDFKALVDRAHGLGLQVLLDVVYNHLGIEGNYLSRFDPALLSSKGESLWGEKFNFDGDGAGAARELVVANALYWLEQCHLDGLRIDSPISIDDDSDIHILEELALAVKAQFAGRRQVHLVLENDHYAGRIKDGDGNFLYRSSLNIAGSECLLSVAGKPSAAAIKPVGLCASIAGGIAFDFGDQWPERTGFATSLQADRQILCLQNHDLIGNQREPERIWPGLAGFEREFLLAIICLSPATPLFFMGDEFGCDQPFPFFCRFSDVSQQQVLEGRARDFGICPDSSGFLQPFDDATIKAAQIRWPQDDELASDEQYLLIKSLLALRRKYIQPLVEKGRVFDSKTGRGETSEQVIWHFDHGWSLGFEWGRRLREQAGPCSETVYRIDAEGLAAHWWVEPS